MFADAILFVTALLWGTNILVFKNAISDFDPWIFNAYRLVLATVTLVGLAILEGLLSPAKSADTKSADDSAEDKQPTSWLRVLLFCLLSGFFYLVIFVKGIDLTTAGNTALILASMPMWTAILSYFALSERLPRVTWLGLLVTFVGTAIVTTQGTGGGSVSFESKYFVGNLFMLLAALAWAAGTVVSRPILQTVTPLRLAAISAVVTTPLHILLVADRLAAAWPAAMQPNNLAAIVYSGVFSTGVAYATWHAGVRAVGGSHASVYQNVVTLVAVIGGWIFLGEVATSAQLIGGALTIAGLVLMRRGRK